MTQASRKQKERQDTITAKLKEQHMKQLHHLKTVKRNIIPPAIVPLAAIACM